MHRSYVSGSSSFGMLTIWGFLSTLCALRMDAKTGVGFRNEVEMVGAYSHSVQERRVNLASNKTYQ